MQQEPEPYFAEHIPWEQQLWYRIGWLGLITIILSYLLVAQLFLGIIPPLPYSLLLANTAGEFLGMLLPSLLLLHLLPTSLKTITYDRPPTTGAFWLWSTFGFAALLTLTFSLPELLHTLLPDPIAQWWIEQRQQRMQQYQQLFSSVPLPFRFLGAAIVPAFAEETLFRGFLLNTLQLRHSPQTSLLLNALLFALIHLDIAYLLELCLLGYYLAFLARYSRSLWVPIGFHAINNILAILTFSPEDTAATVASSAIWALVLLCFAGAACFLLALIRLRKTVATE